MMKCAYCGGTEFYEGPSGGMSTNVLCANPECRHWFNYSPLGMDDLNRVEPTDEEKAAEAAAREQAVVDERGVVYSQGKAIYCAGKPARECLTGPGYGGGYSNAFKDNMRLAGWMDAMRDDISTTWLVKGARPVRPR